MLFSTQLGRRKKYASSRPSFWPKTCPSICSSSFINVPIGSLARPSSEVLLCAVSRRNRGTSQVKWMNTRKTLLPNSTSLASVLPRTTSDAGKVAGSLQPIIPFCYFSHSAACCCDTWRFVVWVTTSPKSICVWLCTGVCVWEKWVTDQNRGALPSPLVLRLSWKVGAQRPDGHLCPTSSTNSSSLRQNWWESMHEHIVYLCMASHSVRLGRNSLAAERNHDQWNLASGGVSGRWDLFTFWARMSGPLAPVDNLQTSLTAIVTYQVGWSIWVCLFEDAI